MTSERRLYPGQAERRHRMSLKAKGIATRGEDLAVGFLQQNHYTLLARNFRAGRSGEIDIVAIDPHGVVTFVEVKTRSVYEKVFGIPEIGFEAVGYGKQKKIQIASARFMSQSRFTGMRWRYDVIVIGISPDSAQTAEITHVMGAFD